MSASACAERSEDNVMEAVSVHHMGPRTQVVRLGNESLYPLSRLSELPLSFM